MFIEEMQILVDCKRLVEALLVEKKWMLEKFPQDSQEYAFTLDQIKRMEDALNGKGVRPHVHP